MPTHLTTATQTTHTRASYRRRHDEARHALTPARPRRRIAVRIACLLAAMAVLEALLSEEGCQSVTAIIGGDQYLADHSSTEDSLGQYYLAFFGDPSGWG